MRASSWNLFCSKACADHGRAVSIITIEFAQSEEEEEEKEKEKAEIGED
jgi:hypothetical protein